MLWESGSLGRDCGLDADRFWLIEDDGESKVIDVGPIAKRVKFIVIVLVVLVGLCKL